ncbi:MAG: EamA family transporter [Rhodobiaceae bacterium]|nr:EamA family transporter [Rhodobiaceae bacterium]
MSTRDWLLVVALGTVWGSAFLAVEILLFEMPPLWIGVGRSVVAGIACWALVLAMRVSMPRRPAVYMQMLGLGMLAYGVPFTLFPLAQEHLTGGVTAIVNAMVPINTIVISQFWPGGEKATRRKLVGVALGFAGVYILAAPAIAVGAGNQILGIVLTFIGTATYAFSLVLTPKVEPVHPSVFAATSITGAALISVPVALIAEEMPGMPSLKASLILLALGIAVTMMPLQVMYRLIPRIGPTNFSSIIFVVPAAAVILGIVVLGEPFTLAQLAGMLTIFAGLMVIDGRLMQKIIRRGISPISS